MPEPSSAEAHARRRARLARRLGATLEPLLDREDYAELTVAQIIDAVGISRSTFYVYFRDKADLLASVAEGVLADLADAGRSWWDLPGDGTWQDVRDAIRPAAQTYRANRGILRSVIETAGYEPGLRAQYASLLEHTAAALTAHIRAGQRRGVTDVNLDPARTSKWLVWMFERGLYQMLGPASDAEAEALVDSVTDIVWRTLYEGWRGSGGLDGPVGTCTPAP